MLSCSKTLSLVEVLQATIDYTWQRSRKISQIRTGVRYCGGDYRLSNFVCWQAVEVQATTLKLWFWKYDFMGLRLCFSSAYSVHFQIQMIVPKAAPLLLPNLSLTISDSCSFCPLFVGSLSLLLVKKRKQY